MKPVKYHPEAEREVIDSALFYDARIPGLGSRFWDAVDDAVQFVAENPNVGAPGPAGTRKWRVKHLPFAIFYEAQNDVTYVYAVAHFSRRPRYWIHRVSS